MMIYPDLVYGCATAQEVGQGGVVFRVGIRLDVLRCSIRIIVNLIEKSD